VDGARGDDVQQPVVERPADDERQELRLAVEVRRAVGQHVGRGRAAGHAL